MATSNVKTPRITKAQRFEDIAALLNNLDAPNKSTVEELQEFIAHEVELLAKKNASADKRKSADAEKNDALKALIVDFLASAEGDGMTCTEIGKSIPELATDYSTSKYSSLCNGLVKDGILTKAKGKGDRTLFKLA